jgi:hypothetical protein
MNRQALQLGFWSALLAATTFVVFTVAFVAIVLSGPLFVWSTMDAYIAHVTAAPQFWKHLAQLMMLLFGGLFVVLLHSIEAVAAAAQKFLARISISFGVAFAVTIGIHYFAQISMVRQNEVQGQFDGLAWFVQANPYSYSIAIAMLGVTFFFALSSLFIAPALVGPGPVRVARYAFFANGVFCLLGGVGYVMDIPALTFVTVNLGMGGAVLAATMALAVWFRRASAASPSEALEFT